jgi:hypothetical protein
MDKGLERLAEVIYILGLAYLAVRYNSPLCGLGAILSILF